MRSEKYIDDAISAAISGGKAIMDVYKTDDFDVDFKADNSPLTKADKAAHIEIMAVLAKTEYPVLSEEGVELSYDERRAWKNYWCVDPLDGTKEFIKRNGEFTVNIALVANQVPVMGVIYVPVLNELYIGLTGKGAYKLSNISSAQPAVTFEEVKRNGTLLPFDHQLSKFTVVGSRSHMTDETKQLIEKLAVAHGETEIISKGSSLKLCMVAEGLAHIYPRFAPTMEWDTAAGHAIALAAGFEVTREDGVTPLLYNKENLLNPWFIVKPKGMLV